MKKQHQEPSAAYKAHVLVLPFHSQGHMNTMIQFSKRLASKGLKVTVAAALSATKSIPPPATTTTSITITFHSIYDDTTQDGFQGPGGIKDFMDRFQAAATINLSDLIKEQQTSTCPVSCIVYDGNLPWALDVAREFGVAGAAFFTQSCAAIARYHEIMALSESGDDVGVQESVSGLGLSTLGSLGLIPVSGQLPFVLEMIMEQFSNLDKADWVLFNSFDSLEDVVVKYLAKLFPVRTIGPTVPSMYLDRRLQEDQDYGFNLFKSDSPACLNWLNTKQSGSVVYVSFGSVANLCAEQMEELAWGLKESNNNFLWVVRSLEAGKLPNNFVEETAERGLVVTWSPQLEVLAHDAVGCFMTHCGWNSTVEGVSLGVSMIAMPQYLDQFSDAKFIELVWRTGVRATVDEKGIVTREVVKACIKEVMEGDRSEEIKSNACKWKELAKEALVEGGSSDKNIDEIVARLVSSTDHC